MVKFLLGSLILLVLAAGLVIAGQTVFAQGGGGLSAQGGGLSPVRSGDAAPTPVPAPSDAGVQGNTIVPNALTGFTVSNPYCYQPDPAVDSCYVNFRYISASDNQSAAPYMTWLSITILGKIRFNETAFFEGTITYTYDQNPTGFKVPCGAPNAGGAGALFGNVYGVTIQPLDSTRAPMSTDIANVTCPAFAP